MIKSYVKKEPVILKAVQFAEGNLEDLSKLIEDRDELSFIQNNHGDTFLDNGKGELEARLVLPNDFVIILPDDGVAISDPDSFLALYREVK